MGLHTIEDDNSSLGICRKNGSDLDGRQRPYSEDDTQCNNSMQWNQQSASGHFRQDRAPQVVPLRSDAEIKEC